MQESHHDSRKKSTGIRDEEAKRRRLVISQALGEILSSNDLQHAIRISDEQFAHEDIFSPSEYLHALLTAMPHLQFGSEVRLKFLRTSRLPIEMLPDVPEPLKASKSISSDHPSSAQNLIETATETVAYLEAALAGRRETRKTTYLMGRYQCESDPAQSGSLVIENVSSSGLGLRILGAHHMRPGIICQIQFSLDDTDETEIALRLEVRWVTGNNIGGSILSTHELSQTFINYAKN